MVSWLRMQAATQFVCHQITLTISTLVNFSILWSEYLRWLVKPETSFSQFCDDVCKKFDSSPVYCLKLKFQFKHLKFRLCEMLKSHHMTPYPKRSYFLPSIKLAFSIENMVNLSKIPMNFILNHIFNKVTRCYVRFLCVTSFRMLVRWSN